MNTSMNNNINILDLPNEILLIIFNKLNMINVLYSLVDVNERFNRLIFDPLYVQNLDLTVKSLSNRNSSINNQIVGRICEKILPRIHDQVNKLTCELHLIEHILTINYCELYSLSLINCQKETFSQYLTGSTILRYLFTNQITHLVVDIKDETTAELSDQNQLNIFSLILLLSKRLSDLTFCEWSDNGNLAISIFNLPSTSCMSSTLIKLNIVVDTFDDCLYLLDGRLECLSTLIIDIQKIFISLSNIDNTKKLLKLKHFSLTSVRHTIYYDQQIIPLLHRMINLEELTLFLTILRHNSNYIDGTHLYDEILVHMPQLNKFSFSINTEIIVINNIKIDFPSNDKIQFSFTKRGNNQVRSYADFNSIKNIARCHVYSLPYPFELFINLNNFYQGGIFNKVRYLVMNDRSPFKHDLFKLVSQDFPYLENLYVSNVHPQKNKQHSSTLIVFPHLIALDLCKSHVDYAEQLLFEEYTRLPRLLELTIRYETLAIVTNNFTNGAARLNCVNLQNIHVEEPFVPPENFHEYFPLL